MSSLNLVIRAIIGKSDAPISGYDIAKAIKDKTGNSHQQIYRELAKIAKGSGIKVDFVKQQDKPDKKLYSYTDKPEVLALDYGNTGDYSKTKLAYEILVDDILNGTDVYSDYIAAMKEAESKFIKSKDDQ